MSTAKENSGISDSASVKVTPAAEKGVVRDVILVNKSTLRVFANELEALLRQSKARLTDDGLLVKSDALGARDCARDFYAKNLKALEGH